jgi:hypothetical protein
MNRSKMAFGTVSVFGLAVVLAGVGDSSFAVACDTAAKTASATASCCSNDKSASAASVEGKKLKHMRVATASTAGACTRDAAMSASASGCTRSATTTASMKSDCEAAHAAAAGCETSTAMAAGAGSCCESKSVKTAAMEGCEAKTASAKHAVDKLPYAENRRVVLAGTYECGHCELHLTDECSPMLKTADGKIYPLLHNARVEALREAKCANGVEVSGLVRKIDGVKVIDVKSYRAL